MKKDNNINKLHVLKTGMFSPEGEDFLSLNEIHSWRSKKKLIAYLAKNANFSFYS